MTTPDNLPPEPASLRLLRRLVTTLTVVMILGVIAVVGLLVIRLQPADAPPLPSGITLPAGERALAITQGTDWFAVVTTDGAAERIHILAPDGTLRQTVEILPD
ncbi:DUF6476 family protein [Roseobacter sp. HKCCA0434]|uniref:DUF6476 family protein n=1 Tax=Roseobacter sp. HKCCA0434 TaxID=3079297 RepID=UPI002905B563|nr:DUF6476 family protein [Roseobacter sp. HKCCA0434]